MQLLFKKLYIYLKRTNPDVSARKYLGIYIEVQHTCQPIKNAIEEWLDTGQVPDKEIKLKANGQSHTITAKDLVNNMGMDPLRALLTLDAIICKPDISARILDSWLHRPMITESIEERRNKVNPEILKIAEEMIAKEEQEVKSQNPDIATIIDELSKSEEI